MRKKTIPKKASPDRISHSQAVEMIRREATRKWNDTIHSIEQLVGRSRPDVVTFNEKHQIYTIFEVKTKKQDLQRANQQLSQASLPFLDKGFPVSKFIAVTRDLYAEMIAADEWSDFVRIMNMMALEYWLFMPRKSKLYQQQMCRNLRRSGVVSFSIPLNTFSISVNSTTIPNTAALISQICCCTFRETFAIFTNSDS